MALIDTKYPTPWNQIEAAMAYTKGHPLMLIIEKGLKSEGLLEKGNDWYVLWANPDISVLTTLELMASFPVGRKRLKTTINARMLLPKKPAYLILQI
ncbi:MAG: hypothetical protein WDO16_25330 [Bacteroidota bacterium]